MCPKLSNDHEIERRWRILRFPNQVFDHESQAIVQGYADCPSSELFVQRDRSTTNAFELIIRPPEETSQGAIEWRSSVSAWVFEHLNSPKNAGKVRIREIDKAEWILTVKGDGTLDHLEWNQPVPRQIAQHLFARSDKRLIFKERTPVLHGDLVLEFDEFHRKLYGLLIVECEFSSIDEANAFVLPSWIVDAIEITEDKRFSNKNLACYGLPTL